MRVFLDTHTAVFLWEGRKDVWEKEGRFLLEHGSLVISPLVDLELEYLFEVGKLIVPPANILMDLSRERHVSHADDPLSQVVAAARGLTWTRDPFDRLITAHAELHSSPLVTKDRLIRSNYPKAVW